MDNRPLNFRHEIHPLTGTLEGSTIYFVTGEDGNQDSSYIVVTDESGAIKIKTPTRESVGLGAGINSEFAIRTGFTVNGTFEAPNDGIIELYGIGAGGGGYQGVVTSGGGSGAWGYHIGRVDKGQSVHIQIGLAGDGGNVDNDATNGGDTSFTTPYGSLICKGGFASSKTNQASGSAPAPTTLAVFGAAGGRGQAAGSGTIAGGAGVNLLRLATGSTDGYYGLRGTPFGPNIETYDQAVTNGILSSPPTIFGRLLRPLYGSDREPNVGMGAYGGKPANFGGGGSSGGPSDYADVQGGPGYGVLIFYPDF